MYLPTSGVPPAYVLPIPLIDDPEPVGTYFWVAADMSVKKYKYYIFYRQKKKLFKKKNTTLDMCILREKNFSADVFWYKKIIFFQMDGHLCYEIKSLKCN